MRTGEDAPLLSSSKGSSSTSVLTTQKKLLEFVPPSLNGLALGFCGLGMTWQATELLYAPTIVRLVADIVALVSFNVGTTLLLIYVCKIIMAPRHALEDLMSVSGNATLPCFDMSLMMLAGWLYGHGLHLLASYIWFVATAIHVFLLIFFIRHLIRLDWDQVTPAWMIPPIGIALAGGTGVGIGIGDGAAVFFWIGFGSFVVFLPAALYRAHSYPTPMAPNDEALYPIFAAPCALLLTNWIAIGGHQGHTLTHFLFLAELVCIALVLIRLPSLAALPFCPQQASFTFPSDVTAKAFILYSSLYGSRVGILPLAAWALVVVATLAVFVTFARFCAVALAALREQDRPAAPVPAAVTPSLVGGENL